MLAASCRLAESRRQARPVSNITRPLSQRGGRCRSAGAMPGQGLLRSLPVLSVFVLLLLLP